MFFFTCLLLHRNISVLFNSFSRQPSLNHSVVEEVIRFCKEKIIKMWDFELIFMLPVSGLAGKINGFQLFDHWLNMELVLMRFSVLVLIQCVISVYFLISIVVFQIKVNCLSVWLLSVKALDYKKTCSDYTYTCVSHSVLVKWVVLEPNVQLLPTYLFLHRSFITFSLNVLY